MTRWLESGVRRDACVILYDEGELTGQRLKSTLERRYDDRLDPKRFYARLDSLIENGHVEKRADGLADVYSLTDAGERLLENHYEWVFERVDGGADGD